MYCDKICGNSNAKSRGKIENFSLSPDSESKRQLEMNKINSTFKLEKTIGDLGRWFRIVLYL